MATLPFSVIGRATGFLVAQFASVVDANNFVKTIIGYMVIETHRVEDHRRAIKIDHIRRPIKEMHS